MTAARGGFRLQPASFGRTLHHWETYWVDAGLETQLERWLDRLDELLKGWDVPAPSEGTAPDDL